MDLSHPLGVAFGYDHGLLVDAPTLYPRQGVNVIPVLVGHWSSCQLLPPLGSV